MPLDKEVLKFHLTKIIEANSYTFASTIKHLFNYLEELAASNSIYEKYEKDYKEKWHGWEDIAGPNTHWKLPENIEDVQSLAYHLYKTAAETNEKGLGFTHQMYLESNINENIDRFNQDFSDYFIFAMDRILEEDRKMHNIHEFDSSSSQIFIIHGHDNELKREVQLLLNRANLQDVVLHEQADGGRTIIEKLIEESEKACFAIVLLSPDDELAEGIKRARQNVILELGYFLGKLGKNKVRLIKKGNVEIPSDIQGILYIDYDKKGAWRIKLIKEMKDVGLNINVDKTIQNF